MQPTKPYLLRAFYDWIVDSHYTPYLLLDAEIEGVFVPKEHIKEGKIVLNISSFAITKLKIDNDAIYFNARFSGVEKQIYAPMQAVLAIYAKENGRGMVFEGQDEQNPPPDSKGGDGKKDGGGHLRVVK